MHSSFDSARVCAVVLAGGRGLRMGGVDKGLQPFKGQPLVQHAVRRLQSQAGGAPGLIAINANRNLPSYAALGACRAFGANGEKAPQRAQFLPDLHPHSPAMGKKDGEKWAAAALLQPAFDKSDRLLGIPVWPDANDEFAGPLAGFETALEHLAAPPQAEQGYHYLLTVPCDSPLFPLDLLQRLWVGMRDNEADIAVALAPDTGKEGHITLRTQPVFALLKCSLRQRLQDYLGSGQRKIDSWFQQNKLAQVAFNLPQDDPHAFANANTLEELSILERQ